MKRVAALCVVLVCGLWSAGAEAAPPLDLASRVGKATWGESLEQVLSDYREQMVARFRKKSAGNTDPVKVEELRREVDASVKRATDSLERFDTDRTGYETSVISGEFKGASGVTMLTIRPSASLSGQFQYVVFTNGVLTKILIPYPMASIDYQNLDVFMGELAKEFGQPDRVERRVDDIGVKLVHEVTWDDGVTRVRLLERSVNLGAHLLVIEDSTKPIVSGQVDASVKPRRTIEDLLGGEGEGPMEQESEE